MAKNILIRLQTFIAFIVICCTQSGCAQRASYENVYMQVKDSVTRNQIDSVEVLLIQNIEPEKYDTQIYIYRKDNKKALCKIQTPCTVTFVLRKKGYLDYKVKEATDGKFPKRTYLLVPNRRRVRLIPAN